MLHAAGLQGAGGDALGFRAVCCQSYLPRCNNVAVDATAAGLIAEHWPDLVVFGHSHKAAHWCADGVHYVNPGSAGECARNTRVQGRMQWCGVLPRLACVLPSPQALSTGSAPSFYPGCHESTSVPGLMHL
jgi:hypothetical protein